MDLAGIRQQVLSNNTSAQEKTEELLLERAIYELSSKEWRELLAGIPADVSSSSWQEAVSLVCLLWIPAHPDPDALLDSVQAASKQTLNFFCGWRICFNVFGHTEIRCTV